MSVFGNEFRYVLTLDNTEHEIIFAPDGYDTDTIVDYKRDAFYLAVIRSMSLPLQFVLDGADILRRAFYTYGIQAGVRIDVYSLNKSNLTYDLIFTGDIDFSEFDDQDTYVSVTLMQAGITANLKAYDNVKYEFALTGSDVVNVILPGVVFKEKADWIFKAYPTAYDRSVAGLDLVNNDGNSGFVVFQNTDVQNLNIDQIPNSPNWFAYATRNIAINFVGRMSGSGVKPFGGSGNDFRIQVRDQNGTVVQQLYLSPSMNVGDEIDFNFDFNFNYNASAGQRFYIYMGTDTFPAVLKCFINEGDLTISYSAQSDPSNCKGLRAIDLYRRLVNRFSPGTPIQSAMINSNWSNLIYTSGDGIREIENAKIKIAFKDFFQDWKGLQDVALGIENGMLRLETGDYFARNVRSVNVGAVKKCSITVADEYVYNSFEVGYEDGNTDDTDGRQEYNSKQEWANVITRIQKKADWVCSSRADQYGIEKLRIDYVKKTSDTSSDNDTFLLDCYVDGDNFRPILGSSYDFVSGLTSPSTAYNLRLTPKQNLLRHAPYLRSIMDKLDGTFINFTSGEKNTELTTIKDGVRVKENENIPVSSLNGKYFLPYIATIECKLPTSTLWMIDSVPFGYVEFTYKNVTLKGFILEASVDIAKNTQREFKLLLTADNDLSKLIK